jgi:hypothetical protein
MAGRRKNAATGSIATSLEELRALIIALNVFFAGLNVE